MQGIEYHHDSCDIRNGYDPSLPLMMNSSGSGLTASLSGNHRQFNRNNNNENYPIGNDAFNSSVPSTFSDSKSMDQSMTDAMGEYNNDISSGGCNGSTEAWWTNSDEKKKKKKTKTSSPSTVTEAITSTASTSSTANTTRTSLGPGPGPPVEVNGIDRSFLYNNTSAGDHGARASLINSSSGGACANEHNFDELTNSNHERLIGIKSDSYNYYSSSDSFGHVNARSTNVDDRGDGRIVSDNCIDDYNNKNNENGINNSSSAGIDTGVGNSAFVTASRLSSSISSSLSFLPTPPLTATSADSLALSSGSGPQFGGSGETQNQEQDQFIYQQQGQNLFRPTQQQQQQQQQLRHNRDNQQQQIQSFHSGANHIHNHQELSQQQYEHQAQQHLTQQIELEQQQQDQYNRTANSAPQSQGMAPATQKDVMPNTNGVTTKSAISVACMWCRSKHLKCDGGVRCSRCQAEGFVCSYPKSRRGFKGPRKAKALLSARRHDSMTHGKSSLLHCTIFSCVFFSYIMSYFLLVSISREIRGDPADWNNHTSAVERFRRRC